MINFSLAIMSYHDPFPSIPTIFIQVQGLKRLSIHQTNPVFFLWHFLTLKGGELTQRLSFKARLPRPRSYLLLAESPAHLMLVTFNMYICTSRRKQHNSVVAVWIKHVTTGNTPALILTHGKHSQTTL